MVFTNALAEQQQYVQKEQEIAKLQAEINNEVYVEPANPEVAAPQVDSAGRAGVFCSADMAGLSFLQTLGDTGLKSSGGAEDATTAATDTSLEPRRRRLAATEEKAFSMDSFIKFHIERGGEDSASIEDLAFVVGSAGIEGSLLLFKLDFENPQKVSIGETPDKAIATIVDGSFFADEATGISIPTGTTIDNVLPKMLPGEQFVMVMETTKETIETTAQGILVAQILITLILAVSLKSMWNLYNVIQIMAYIRFFTAWPAFMMEIFTHMDNAVTLKPISDPMFEYGMTGF